MRTISEIESDLRDAESAGAAMSGLDSEDTDEEGRGIFLDNVQRRISDLNEELGKAKDAQKNP